ncbi:hypothetical protein BGZ97_002348 [Linnemannia gamsii]|uniref:Uncharacterized protein n=1 Tax=Linnemannia gamsii TaxID=64522 RepID=A0A9P6RHU7_9FUNG|nr:hypothetical protein BGZ97_002348 [Linnemannia gamsii]
MTSHPSSGWRRTVGAQWSSVKRQNATPSPIPTPPMQQGMHSSLLVALSRPDLDQEYQQQQQQQLLLQQQQELQQLEQQQQHHQQEQQALLLQQQQQQQHQHQAPASSYPTGSMFDHAAAHHNTQSEHQRALQQFNENQKQQQLYLQQLQLMQRLQSMPGSTTRPWYPTFGPAITTSCSDSTILLDSPHQYRLINNAKLNRHAVGPHWRSIQTSSTYSPTPSPPSSSPQLQARTLTPPSSSLSSSSSSSSPLTMPTTTTALHAYISSTYSSAASIDQARATSFRQHGHGLGMGSTPLPDGRQGVQDEPVHHQFYQSHSYAHNPRHHPAYHPGSSREARDTIALANRASPSTSTSERFADSSRKTKRKATWQDQDNNNNEDGDGDDEDENETERSNGNNNRQNENNSDGVKPSMSSDSSQGFQPMSLSAGCPPRSESQTAPQSYSIQSSVQQFVPITTSTANHGTSTASHHLFAASTNGSNIEQDQDQDQDQDQEMGSVDSISLGGTANAASLPTPSSRPSPMSMETSSVDQEDMDVVLTSATETGPRQLKRTKPRLNPNVFGTMSIAETLREQSGERIQDIFQECFYNAASSSTR